MLLASACGGNDSEGSGDTTTQAPGAETTVTAAPGAETTTSAAAPSGGADGAPSVVEDATTIQFWFPGGLGRDESAAATIEAFKAVQPNITVELTAFPFNEFNNAVQVALAGGSPPDVVLLNGISVQTIAYNGGLASLSDLFTAEDMADFAPDLVDFGTWDGELYGAPWQNSAIAMYYNVDYFEAAGVEVPKTLEEVWTWPEYKENVEKVMAHQADLGNDIWGTVGLNTPIQSSYFIGALLRSNSEPGSNGYKAIADDLSTVDGYINTPETIEALEFYQSLYTGGFSPKESVPDAFGTGAAATFYAIPPIAGGLNANFPDLNWDVMPFPYFKTPLTHTGSFMPTIPAKSENMEAARAFTYYLASTDGYLAWNAAVPGLPGRTSTVAEVPALQEGYLALLVEEAAAWGVAPPGGPAASIWDSIIGSDMLVNIAVGGDIAEAVADAVSQTDAQLAAANFGG
jgi:ABC-type glycerol-3-phosphate transport system substrate-binding protein